MTTYTVFEDEFEEHAHLCGLTLEQAFAWVLDRCQFDHAFERSAEGHALIVRHCKYPDLDTREIVSTIADASDARQDLMRQAIDGRFKAFMALPDKEFRQRLNAVRAFLEGERVHAP